MIEVPLDRISFTDDDIAKDARRAELNVGWFRFVILDSQLSISKEGSSRPGTYMVVNRCAPLKDPEAAESRSTPYIYHRLSLPFVNPDVQGHTKPSAKVIQPFISTVFDEEVPALPTRLDGKLMFKGQVISPKEEDECRREVFGLVYEYAKKLLADPSILQDRVFYAKVETSEQYGTQINAFSICSVLPRDATLVHPDFFDASKLPTESASVVPKTPAKKGKKK